MQLDPLTFKQPLLLDIGAGGFSSDDKFTSVDAFTECDITANMWDIPLPDASVTAIFSSNALEHISKADLIPTLREWNRLLVPSGRLQVLVPDLEWAVKWWLDHQFDTGWSLDIIFGHQKHDGEYHKTGFSKDSITEWVRSSLNETVKWKVHRIEYMGGSVGQRCLSDNSYESVYENNVDQRLINLELEKIA